MFTKMSLQMIWGVIFTFWRNVILNHNNGKWEKTFYDVYNGMLPLIKQHGMTFYTLAFLVFSLIIYNAFELTYLTRGHKYQNWY